MACTYRLAALLVLLSATACFSSDELVERMLPRDDLNHPEQNLLKGNVILNLLWYGKFTPTQRFVIVNFIRSLSSPAAAVKGPTVASWWNMTRNAEDYASKIVMGEELELDRYPLRFSERPYVDELALKLNRGGGRSITVVLTAKDVTVKGFCNNRCGTHGPKSSPLDYGAYIWVGNSKQLCPDICAWVFDDDQSPVFPPNGDVGIDGMVINLATLLVNTVKNPFKSGYVNENQDATSPCHWTFGPGAYPGYPGRVLVDKTTGASYNALGLAGRKYLLPAIWDSQTSTCKTLF